MSYRIAGIDVHKKMLAVVVTDVEVEGEYKYVPSVHRARTPAHSVSGRATKRLK